MPTWKDLFEVGSIVDPTVKLWRASKTLRPVDLGLEDSEEVRRALSLGRTRLAPREVFEDINSAATRARKLVEDYSVKFSRFVGARFVPETKLPKLLEKLAVQQKAFYEAVDVLLAGYEKMKADMLPVIQKALQDAAKDAEAAQRAFAEIEQAYPTAAVVRSKFSFTWEVSALTSPKTAATPELLGSETAKVKSVIDEMVRDLRSEVKAKLQDLLQTAGKDRRFSDKSVEAAREVLDRIQEMNIFDDLALTQLIAKVRSALDSLEDGKFRTGVAVELENARKALDESAEAAVKAAEEKLTGLGRRRMEV